MVVDAVAVSHDQSKGGCRTGFESKIDTVIEDIAFQEVLSVIKSAKGHQIAISTAVTSVWNAHER